MKKLVAIALSLILAFSGVGALAEYAIQDANVTAPGELPVVKDKITLTVGMMTQSNTVSMEYGENYMTTWLEDKTGVHLEWVLYPDVSTDAYSKLRLQVSGGETLPDILHGFDLNTDSVRESYGQAGALIALNDYIGSLDYYHAQALAKTKEALEGINLWTYGRSLDGNYYGMLGLYRTLPNFYSARAWYNRDFAAALGMEDPGELPTQEWFLTYLRGVRDNDVNGNGDPSDEIPMIGGTGWNQDIIRWCLKMYTYIDYTNNYLQIKDGVLSNSYTTDEYREGLKFVRQLYDEKLFPDYALTQDNATYGSLMASATPVVGVGVSGSCSSFGTNMASMNPIPVVEGPEGFASATYLPQLPQFNTCITSDCEYPEAAFRMFDAWNCEEWFMLVQRWGEPGLDWDYAAEGAVGMYDSMGMSAYFTILQSSWGVPTYSHWGGQFFGGIDYADINSRFSWDGNEQNNEYKNALAVTKQVAYAPEEYIYKIIYSVDEQETWANARAAIDSYVKESNAAFATGQLDINDDAAWAEFQANIKALGSEGLLAMDQAAYNRTMGIE